MYGIHGDRGWSVGWSERPRGWSVGWCGVRGVAQLCFHLDTHPPLAAEPCVSSNRMQPLAPDRIWSGLGE